MDAVIRANSPGKKLSRALIRRANHAEAFTTATNRPSRNLFDYFQGLAGTFGPAEFSSEQFQLVASRVA